MDDQEQLKIVRSDPTAIKHIANPSKIVQIEAVCKDVVSIWFIENPCEEAQLYAIRKHRAAIGLIQNPTDKVKRISSKKGGEEIVYRFFEKDKSCRPPDPIGYRFD